MVSYRQHLCIDFVAISIIIDYLKITKGEGKDLKIMRRNKLYISRKKKNRKKGENNNKQKTTIKSCAVSIFRYQSQKKRIVAIDYQ